MGARSSHTTALEPISLGSVEDVLRFAAPSPQRMTISRMLDVAAEAPYWPDERLKVVRLRASTLAEPASYLRINTILLHRLTLRSVAQWNHKRW